MRNRRFIFNLILWILLASIILFLGASSLSLFSKENESIIPKNMSFKESKPQTVATQAQEIKTTIAATKAIQTKAESTTTTKEKGEDEDSENEENVKTTEE